MEDVIPMILKYRDAQDNHRSAVNAERNAREELHRIGEEIAKEMIRRAQDQVGAEFNQKGQLVKIVDIRTHYRDRSKAVPIIVRKIQSGAWGKRREPLYDLGWDHVNKRWRKLIEQPDLRMRFEDDGRDPRPPQEPACNIPEPRHA